MEEEIDLRPYIKALLRHWYWIIGTALLAAVAAFIVTSFIPPSYEATALVAVVDPRDVVQLDPRIQETNPSQPLQAFPQLALSDQVVNSLLAQNLAEEVETLEDLRERLKATEGDDSSIIRLTATSSNPEEAAQLVNIWAKIFVEWANEIYGHQGTAQMVFFENQLAEMQAELTAVEVDLIEFQAINRSRIISNTLVAYTNAQFNYLEAQRQNSQLIQQVQGLRDQLSWTVNSQSITLADQLTALSLQLQAFEAQTAVPLQLQVSDSAALTSASRAEQLAFLDDLLATLSGRAAQIEAELAALEPRILVLQEEIQVTITEYNRLLRSRLVAEETYMALAHKVETERIIAQDTSRGVRLASEAAVPKIAVETGKLLISVTAGFAGAIISSIAVCFFHWFQREQQ